MPQRSTKWLLIAGVLCACWWQKVLAQHSEVPREWIDHDTGHRVVRLSDEPGSQSLYFHQNPYTPDGQELIITTPTGPCRHHHRRQKTGQVYYTRNRGGRFSSSALICASNSSCSGCVRIVLAQR